VALTPAWQQFFQRVNYLIECAREELEASENWNQFLETRGGLKALRQIAEWPRELMEQVKEFEKEIKGNGYDSRR